MAKLIVTADPDFAEMALDELRPLAARPSATLAAGVWLVELKGSFLALAQRWQERPPIFIRHICPVYATVSLADAAGAVDAMVQAAGSELGELVEPSLPFSVQTRILADSPLKPFDVNTAVSAAIQAQTGARLDPRRPQQILSIVVAGQRAYLGLSLAAHNLSDWAGGARRFAREEGQISRAEFKLLEALEYFKIELPPGGVALDLGAAPGGWTRVLRQREQFVTAVDPADLHPNLTRDGKVRHKRMTAEAYLASGPDPFDLIVNDMRQDARDSARLMVGYAPYLRPGMSGAIMTLKLPENGRENVIDHAFNILRNGYQLAGARHLFHNRSEITVYLRGKGE
jgi:23S rRNA (cytidine2498-2'-O)-methyltransferase